MGRAPRLKTILCPLDVLDPGERQVLEYASRLAEVFGASLHALYVYEVPGIADPSPDASPVRSYAERALTEQRERFGALIDHLPGAFAEPELLPGRPASRIAEQVERLGVDLIVMGTHARRGLRRLFLGSVAENVVRTSSVPVLTLPHGAAWSSVPRSLLVPHDLSETSKRALALARLLHVPLHAAVAAVHVLPAPLGGDGPGWMAEPERARYAKLLEESLSADVSDVFGPEEQAVKRFVAHGEVVDAVLARAEAMAAQLIVIGASGKSGTERVLLGSVTIELLRQSQVPVLTVP